MLSIRMQAGSGARPVLRTAPSKAEALGYSLRPFHGHQPLRSMKACIIDPIPCSWRNAYLSSLLYLETVRPPYLQKSLSDPKAGSYRAAAILIEDFANLVNF
jgi:hypothetical protein